MEFKNYKKLIRKITFFINSLENLISQLEKIAPNLSDSQSKRFFTREYEKFENFVHDIDKNLMREIVRSDAIDLDEFMEGFLKKSTPKDGFERKPKREIKNDSDDVRELMDSIMSRMDSRNYIRHSSTFRNFNKTFNFEKHWLSKNSEGYGDKSILSHSDEIIKIYYPKFIRGDLSTYPPAARWINYADKYSKDYVMSLESPWCFRSALQCYELTMSSREFEFELKKMELIGREAVELFFEYCTQLDIIKIEDKDIETLREIIKDEDSK